MHVLKKSVIVWKKAWSRNHGRHLLVKMRLSKGTKVNRDITSWSKNRASRAKVLEIRDILSGCSGGRLILGKKYRLAYSDWSHFLYRVGKTAYPDDFDESLEECSNGIHFFATAELAAAYTL